MTRQLGSRKFGKSLDIRHSAVPIRRGRPPCPRRCTRARKIIARAWKRSAEVHGVISWKGDSDELKNAIVADALPKNIAGLQRDLGHGIAYDVWSP